MVVKSIKSKCGRFELRFRNGQWVAFCYVTFQNVDRFRLYKDGVETFKRHKYI